MLPLCFLLKIKMAGYLDLFFKIFFFFFDVDHFFKEVFIGFVTILLLFCVLIFWLKGVWGLGSLTRDQICSPGIGRQSLSHWTPGKSLDLL